MSLQAAAYYAGWTAALDVAAMVLDEDEPDAARSALARARFEGIVSAETDDTRRRTLDAAAAAVVELLDAAGSGGPSSAVELVARRLVVNDLDAAAETMTMLALLAHEWRAERDDALAPVLTPRWALGWDTTPREKRHEGR